MASFVSQSSKHDPVTPLTPRAWRSPARDTLQWSLQYTRWHDTHHVTRQHWLLRVVSSSLLISHDVSREMFTVPGSDRDWVLGTAGLRRLGAGSQGSLLHCITPWLPPLAAIIAGLLHINHRNGKMQGKSRANKHWHLTLALLVTFQDEYFEDTKKTFKLTTFKICSFDLLEKVRSNIKRWGSAISQAGKWGRGI